MKKLIRWLILILIASLAAGCLFDERRVDSVNPTPWVITQADHPTPRVITQIVTVTPLPPTQVPTQTPSPALTATPTPAPTATPTPTAAPLCANTYPSRLHVGDEGTVSREKPLSNNVRKDPGLDSGLVIGTLKPGEPFFIISGPQCKDEMVWWKVRSLRTNLEGWTSEGMSGEYWLVPLGNVPTPIPDYTPGGGMAVLVGDSPYELSILRGGWQAYQIGPSTNKWGYLVDITPLQPAVEGAYVEYKILPEYFAGQWVDVLWLRAPGIRDFLPVRLDLIPTKGWTLAFEANVRLTPGDWMGFIMFSNGEGCGGVLDISPANTHQVAHGAYIANTRVQPEFPSNWVQVSRVALSNGAVSQQAWLRYYSPGLLAQEVLRKEASLPAGLWSGWVVADSQANLGYVVEVIPLKNSNNEVAFSVVRPEFTGTKWEDVLRVYVPEGRPVLEALLRVLAVPVQ